MKNRLEDLRDYLFVTIEGLLDEENPMNIDRAKAVAVVSNSMIESAKVEVKYLETVGSKELGSGFIPNEPRNPVPAETLKLISNSDD